MPNTNPPTVTVAALEDKVLRAGSVTDCAIRFFFGATETYHLREFKAAWTSPELRPHLAGLKLYFDHSTGDQKADSDVIEQAFQLCSKLNAPIVAHCEDPGVNAIARQKRAAGVLIYRYIGTGGEIDVSQHSMLRPPESEEKAVRDAIELARRHGTQFHIAHLSTKGALELARGAKQEGLPVTCEVAPHHLFLTVDDYSTLGTLGKMNPPLREASDRDALWEGLADGTVDCIATDHAPHTLEEKRTKDPSDAPSGVPGVETMLPLLLSVASGHWPHPSSRRPNIPIFPYSNILSLCFTNPNRIFSLGALEAPRIHVDPDAEWTIHGKDLHAKCGWTPYEGWKVRGRVVRCLP